MIRSSLEPGALASADLEHRQPVVMLQPAQRRGRISAIGFRATTTKVGAG